jgi:Holliday junction resolvase RusA-like endonuclease
MISFTISGKPLPQKRHRFARGRKHCYDPSSADKKQFVAKIPRNEIPGELISGPVRIKISCFFGGKKKGYMTARPDADNLAKFVLDALSRVIYNDDSQVVELLVKKFRCPPEEARTEVTIEKITNTPVEITKNTNQDVC